MLRKYYGRKKFYKKGIVFTTLHFDCNLFMVLHYINNQERLARAKRSSLFDQFVNYKESEVM